MSELDRITAHRQTWPVLPRVRESEVVLEAARAVLRLSPPRLLMWLACGGDGCSSVKEHVLRTAPH